MRLNISLRCVDIQQRGGKRLSICIFFLFRSTVVMVMCITNSIWYLFSFVHILWKSRKEKRKEKNYFGTSGYSQEDITAAVLFADNLSRGDIYT